MAGSRSVVIAALIANGAIAVLKFVGFTLTGSPAMLSETYHSISDTGNQVFLLIGIRYGSRAADERHPFGYGKAQFFYSFLVSVLLFGIAGWESAKHGYHEIQVALGESGGHGGLDPVTLFGQTFPPVYVNYVVLIGAIVFESWALYKARAEMKRQIAANDWSGYREAFRKTADTTTLTALTEDAIALGGAGIALIGVFLTRSTGNPLFDAASALLIGLLLMGFALALAWQNKRLLMGESLPLDAENRLRGIVADVEDVVEVVDFRSVYFGPSSVVVTADVDFRKGLTGMEIDDRISAIETALKEADDDITAVYVEVEKENESSVTGAGGPAPGDGPAGEGAPGGE
jgi:cation diffusion facilitator family transporter